MTKVQAIREFASLVAGERVTIPRERDCWSMSMASVKPRLILPPDPDQNDEEDKAFRRDFISRCPIAKGFANVTLSILHEIGHHFNREIYISRDENEEDYESHFALPYEIVATDWAIAWLQDPTHRKIAKDFEKKYFGYGKE